jgi:hypothetical protein
MLPVAGGEPMASIRTATNFRLTVPVAPMPAHNPPFRPPGMMFNGSRQVFQGN